MKRLMSLVFILLSLSMFLSCDKDKFDYSKKFVYVVSDSSVVELRIIRKEIIIPTYPGRALEWALIRKDICFEKIPDVVPRKQGIYLLNSGKCSAVSGVCVIIPRGEINYIDDFSGKRCRRALSDITYVAFNKSIFGESAIEVRKIEIDDLFFLSGNKYNRIYRLVNNQRPGFIKV